MLASCHIMIFFNASSCTGAASWKMFWLKEFCDGRFSIVFGICFYYVWWVVGFYHLCS